MIPVSISQLILVYTAMPLFILLVMWFFLGKRVMKFLNTKPDVSNFLVTCPFCRNEFIDTKNVILKKCPNCENFFKTK